MSKLTEIQQAFVVLDAGVQEVLNATDKELKGLVSLLKLALPLVEEVELKPALGPLIKEAIREYHE